MAKILAFFLACFAAFGQTLSVINTGTTSNDGTGDSLRTAFTKANTNFYQLWSEVFTNIPVDIANAVGVKLNATNGTAVDLTLSGTAYYGGSGKNNVVDGVGYALGMRYQTNGTPTLYPTALSVATIADLASKVYTDTVTTNSIIEVRGYATDGDGGGGTFYYATASATNRIDTFASGSGSFVWKRVPPADGVLSPAMAGMFGSRGVGDNMLTVADSTMSTNTYSGGNNWGTASTSFQSADLTTVAGKLYFQLKAAPAGSQSISLPGTRMANPGGAQTGRFLVKFKHRLVSGTGVALFFGKGQATQNVTFTPESTEATYNGYFDSTDAASSSFYFGLLSNGSANGSAYTVDDVEVYFVGTSTLTSVPSASDASDEAEEFRALLAYTGNGSGRIVFPPNRIYRVTGGGFVAPQNADIQLSRSELYFDAINSTNGLRFSGNGSLRGGKITSSYSASTNAFMGLIMVGAGQNETVPSGRIVLEDLLISHSATNSASSVIVFGGINTSIRNIFFTASPLTYRPISVVWSGGTTPVTVGYNPSVNILIENIFHDSSGQGFPDQGGGAVVGINGIINATIRNVYANVAGRSLISVAPGDYWDDRYATEYRNKELANVLIQNCAVGDANIGFRVSGSPYLATNAYPMMNVTLDTVSSYGVNGGGVGSIAPGILIEPSVANVTVRGAMIRGHQFGLMVTNQPAIPGTPMWSADIRVRESVFRESYWDGIALHNSVNTTLENNDLIGNGTSVTANYRNGIHVVSGNNNVQILGNTVGRSGETDTNQNSGIRIESAATNTEIAVDGNYIYGAAAAGTPISYGASATFSIIGVNYVGTTRRLLANALDTSVTLGTHRTYDIGTSSTRIRDLYVGRDLYVSDGDAIKFSSTGGTIRSQITSTSSGRIMLSDDDGAGFTALNLGGNTSSYPGLRPNGQNLDVKLGDNSAYADIAVDTVELGGSTDATVARSAAGKITVEDVPVALAPATETLSYSATTVTVTAGKGPNQSSVLTCTNSFTLSFSSVADNDGGTIWVHPAATNCTVTLSSPAYGPSGTTLTITGGTGSTNHTVLAWKATTVNSTNVINVNALNYYR